MHILSRSEIETIAAKTVALPTRLNEQLAIWLNLANTDPCVEIEIRFTRCALTRASWSTVIDRLRSLAHTVSSETTDVFIYRNGVRKCNGQLILKEKRTHIDLDTYGLRFALSRETPTFVEPTDTSNMILRRRMRTSFRLESDSPIRFDCTHVVHPQGGQEAFEIEMEYCPCPQVPAEKKDDKEKTIEVMTAGIHVVLSAIQSSPLVISAPVYSRLTDAYARFFRKSGVFVGAQPVTLHKHHTRGLRNGRYSVAKKADGDRGLLLWFPDGCCFVIDRRMAWRCVYVPGGPVEMALGLTVLDIEILSAKHGKSQLIAFDILADAGEDLRGNKAFPLAERVRRMKARIKQAPSDLNLIAKDYVPYGWGMRESLVSIMGDGDGLIFIPNDEPYPMTSRWPTLFKWKPPQNNSIDFAVSSGGTPYVMGDGGQLVEFSVDGIKMVVESPDNFIADMDIVECTMSISSSSSPRIWHAKRVRTDKTRPNYCTVAMDIWNSICSPLEIRQLNIGSCEALRIHLNYVRNTRAHKLMQTIRVGNENGHRVVRVYDVGNNSDQRRLDTAAEKNGLILEYHGGILNNVNANAHAQAEAVQLHGVVEKHYETETTFTALMQRTLALLVPDGLVSIIFMDGLWLFESSRWSCSGNEYYSCKPAFDHRIFVEEIDAFNDYGAGYTFSQRVNQHRNPECLHLVMPDALTLHLARLGLILVSTERFPEPVNRSVQLSADESDFNSLYRSAIFRRVKIEDRWRAYGDVEANRVVSVQTVNVAEILHMTSGVSRKPPPGLSVTQTLDLLATIHSTVIVIVHDDNSGKVRTHMPAHLDVMSRAQGFTYIEQPMSIQFLQVDEQYYVMGTLMGQEVHILSPYLCSPPPRSASVTSPSKQRDDNATISDVISDDISEATLEANDQRQRLIDTLVSRDMTRAKGAWTIKDLRDFAASEPVLAVISPSLKKKQEIYDELMRLAAECK